jgi:hypothetical protein
MYRLGLALVLAIKPIGGRGGCDSTVLVESRTFPTETHGGSGAGFQFLVSALNCLLLIVSWMQ